MPEDLSESRRRFLGFAIGGMAGAIALGYAVPLASYLIRPALKTAGEDWSEVGDVKALQPGEPESLTFFSHVKVGWEEEKVEHNVWVVKNEDGSVTAFSPICPHLGCGYRWNPATKHFECPCHESVYDITGKVLGGPAPRGLDTLPARVDEGRLFVKYEKFRLGIPGKVEA
jgi:quinol---cytochrome c reductase iron-sulfur subunit, bacillus type